MTIRMRGTKAECEARIRRLSLLLEVVPGPVVYEDGKEAGMTVEVWL